MATVTRGQTFGATETITNTKLHTLVDDATVTGIVNADVSAGAAIAASKLDLTSSGYLTTGENFTITGVYTFTTITSTGDIYTAAWADYLTTSTIVGWATPTGTIYIKKVGNLVFVNYNITGTSNANNATFTVPYTTYNGASIVAFCRVIDNGGTKAAGIAIIPFNSATISLFKSMTDTTDWTTSGTKTVSGQFFYEAA